MSPKISIAFWSNLLTCALGETILGVTVYSRHGDRSSKHYKGYSLTNLGLNQNFQTGSFYREQYIDVASQKQILGISEDLYKPSEIWASAPDQLVLSNTATAFLQGLYPPVDGADHSLAVQTLTNGSSYTNPLNGYQYVLLNAKDSDSPDTIWIKGDDSCPAYQDAADTFHTSDLFQEKVEATKSFYSKFWDILDDVYDYEAENMTYANAYDIYDLINVARIHNESSPAVNVSSADMFQLRTLADSAEWASIYNESQPARSIGGQSLMGGILHQLNQTVIGKGKLKFSLLAGSYDNFMAFFGLANLTSASTNFYGLPGYASTMAFEILTENDVQAFPSSTSELKVRFLFRNGSDSELTAYPLFGQSEIVLPWDQFVSEAESRGILDLSLWCSMCQSTQEFCTPYPNNPAYAAAHESTSTSGKSNMSNAVAGVIGAMVTLGVIATCGLVTYLVLRRRKAPVHDVYLSEKGSSSSISKGD
ncbi:phosphoglycerate mutase-like protein [Patellaria atrata CBS 101060]|uniref:Phosphoglycerate mutase-like protein n=1 Tax=Patellaria atrata CBS 101060 TaxID=1346257 RepID=A0A9P4VUK8_9PEZI|nr:phosphoglycerate mutase-like protein [Patellaria atrata CBS 101060]